jgi:4-amino-4-deoxy-L-arabinose transferase-like glycosyltransferase
MLRRVHPAGSRSGARPRVELAILGLLTLGLLLPFLGKAFHIDDPIYLWTAQQILEHPLDPFGFPVNWSGEPAPLHEYVNNPPLAGYYVALVAWLLGWSERALHAAYLLPALASVWGTWALARGFGAGGFTSALLLCLAPGFVVSSTMVMPDVPTLAFWVCAMAWWDRGLRGGGWGGLLAGAALAGLSPLAKFPGLALFPLLVAHALLRRADWRRWAPCLLVPIGVFGVYHGYTTWFYGHDLLLDPVSYAGSYRPQGVLDVAGRLLCGLSFAGAGMASLLFFAPWLLDRRSARAFAVALLATAFCMLLVPDLVSDALQAQTRITTSLALQLALWTTVGAAVVWLALADARATRSPESIVLLLWMLGVFVFATLLNWTVNMRSILLLLPAAAVLAARRIERRGTRIAPVWGGVAAAAAATLALAVARADALLAGSARDAAHALVTEYRDAGREVWFQGHWGFQYYAERLGAKPLHGGAPVPPGAIVLKPRNNSYLWRLDLPVVARRRFDGPGGCATMDGDLGAGFYASTWGPLPFVFGRASPELYAVHDAAAVRAPRPSPPTPPAGPRDPQGEPGR